MAKNNPAALLPRSKRSEPVVNNEDAFIMGAPDAGQPKDEVKPTKASISNEKEKISINIFTDLLKWADQEAKRRYTNRTGLINDLLRQEKERCESN
jgi:uncharacterized protein (DUF4415 family)